MKYGLLILLLSVPSFIISMEEITRSSVIIQDNVGNLFATPKSVASQCGLFCNVLSDAQGQEEKVYDVSFKGENSFLHASVLNKVFQCIEDNSRCNDTLVDVQDVFEAAFYIEAPRPLLRLLTLLVRKKIPKSNQHEFVKNGAYFNSIQSLIDDNYFLPEKKIVYLKKIGDDEDDQLCLNLARKELDTLKGVKALSESLYNEHIVKIKLNNNFLKRINIKKIIASFSKLRILKVGNNRIKKITMVDLLPEYFFLDLENNKIKQISKFIALDRAKLKLKSNMLTNEAKKTLDRAFPLSLESATDKIHATQELRDYFFKIWIYMGLSLFIGEIYLLSQFCTTEFYFVAGMGTSVFVTFFGTGIILSNNPQWLLPSDQNRRDDVEY